MNIFLGQIAHPEVNADNEVSHGHRAMENFKAGRSDPLYCSLGKLVVTLYVTKNHVLVVRNVSMTRNSPTHVSLVYIIILIILIIIIMAGKQFFNVAGYLIVERRRWPVIISSPRGQCYK